MHVTRKYTATVHEMHPEHPKNGDYAWRLLNYVDPDCQTPVQELERARFSLVEFEPSDVTSGPAVSLELGYWEHRETSMCTHHQIGELVRQHETAMRIANER